MTTRVQYYTDLARQWATPDIWGVDLSSTEIIILDGSGKPSGEAHYPQLRVLVALGQDNNLSKAVVLHELSHIAECRRLGPWGKKHGERWADIYVAAAGAITETKVVIPAELDTLGVNVTRAVADLFSTFDKKGLL